VNKCPNIVNADALIHGAGQCQCGLPDGRWVEARPMGFFSLRRRLLAAWLVLTGRADALTWTGQ